MVTEAREIKQCTSICTMGSEKPMSKREDHQYLRKGRQNKREEKQVLEGKNPEGEGSMEENTTWHAKCPTVWYSLITY